MQCLLQLFRSPTEGAISTTFWKRLCTTVSLIEMERRLAITENLHFDVARASTYRSTKHGSIPKGRQRFALSPR